MDLTGWDYILTYGYSLELYGKGEERVAIDKKSGRVALKYRMSR